MRLIYERKNVLIKFMDLVNQNIKIKIVVKLLKKHVK